ncbi:MAG TPA: anti-sigma factor [Chitinophagaceae bacterium]|nr:anti-sigma factor [Chitinophagaceae bacterium]
MDIKAYIQSGIIESYVLGLASAEEAAELETLCMQHAEIKQAVEDFEALIEKNMAAGSIKPPAELKQQVLDALDDEFEAPKTLVIPPAPATQSDGISGAKVLEIGKPGIWRGVAAAAIILLVASAGLNVYYYKGYKSASDSYQALLDKQATLEAYQARYNSLQQTINIFQDSAMHVVKMGGVKKEEPNDVATIYWDTRTKDVYLFVNNLPQAPAGKQYQLWAIVDGKPVDAGVIGDCDGVCKMKNIPRAEMFAVTLEKAGGNPTPTLNQMYVAGKI